MIKTYIDKLAKERLLSHQEFTFLLQNYTAEDSQYLFKKATNIVTQYYGKTVYIRGLIEFTNYCKNDCYYCGIRHQNQRIERYRLNKDEILACCHEGYQLGFRTFVLQGGEDPYFTKERVTDIVTAIRQHYPDCGITLSIGERPFEDYQTFFDAGANRFLLRHETADEVHYRKLHPDNLKNANRKACLQNLKKIGYQVGTGFMVGSPYQTDEHIAEDLLYIAALKPDMVGIGPYITHQDTPFKDFSSGPLDKTLFLIGLLRLMLPNILIPATTALGTIHPNGREFGLLAGANVVMPNLSPVSVRKKYALYDNKICTGDEAARCIQCLKNRIKKIDREIVIDRGDCQPLKQTI